MILESNISSIKIKIIFTFMLKTDDLKKYF